MATFTHQRPYSGRRGAPSLLFSLLCAGAMVLGAVGGDPVRAAELSVARSTSTQTEMCTDLTGPALPPPAAALPQGIPGYHAAWYGQSGYPIICPGSSATAVVAFMNTGSLGWYSGNAGQAAFLGPPGARARPEQAPAPRGGAPPPP